MLRLSKITLFFLLMGLHSWSQKDPIELKDEMTLFRDSMMRLEKEVSGKFFELREFHNGMMGETVTPEQYPYKNLDQDFSIIHSFANSLVRLRFQADTAVYNKQTWSKELIQVKYKSAASTYSIFLQADSMYWQRADSNGIKRLDYGDMIELLGLKVSQWQDSLEMAGTVVGRAKQNLKMKYPTQKGSEYIQAYQPISSMELQLKQIQQAFSQLENAVSRIEEGNQEEFFYFGPNMRERMEVSSINAIIGSLAIHMTMLRDAERGYYVGTKN